MTSASFCSAFSYWPSMLLRFSGLTTCFWIPGLPAFTTICRKFFSCVQPQTPWNNPHRISSSQRTLRTCTLSRKVKARPVFPALAVLPTLRTDTGSEHVNEGNSEALLTVWWASPVNVCSDVLRCIIVNHTFDPADVDASGHRVCADQPSKRQFKCDISHLNMDLVSEHRSQSQFRKSAWSAVPFCMEPGCSSWCSPKARTLG